MYQNVWFTSPVWAACPAVCAATAPAVEKVRRTFWIISSSLQKYVGRPDAQERAGFGDQQTGDPLLRQQGAAGDGAEHERGLGQGLGARHGSGDDGGGG